MPRIYLSPSVQEYNPYINGGTEEEYMNKIVDAMIPYLEASGIDYTRNSPEQTLSEVIYESNMGNNDFHIAIHSNAAAPAYAGTMQGADVYYWHNSQWGKKGANIIAKHFKEVYPDPSKVKAIPTSTLRELRRTAAPSALIEVGYHDNIEDAEWIKGNVDAIGKNLVMSLAEYFGIPFVVPNGR